MKEFKYYRTYSYKDMYGKELEIREFETIDLAKNDAIMDRNNSNFHLFEITNIFDGRLTETKKYLGKIICGKELDDYAIDKKII